MTSGKGGGREIALRLTTAGFMAERSPHSSKISFAAAVISRPGVCLRHRHASVQLWMATVRLGSEQLSLELGYDDDWNAAGR